MPAQAHEHITVVQLDLSEPGSISAAAAAVLALGPLAAVVHNAGVPDAGFFEDVTQPQLREVFETNFFGPLALTRALLPALRAQGFGRIVAISSIGAFAASPALSAYSDGHLATAAWPKDH